MEITTERALEAMEADHDDYVRAGDTQSAKRIEQELWDMRLFQESLTLQKRRVASEKRVRISPFEMQKEIHDMLFETARGNDWEKDNETGVW